ncbi:hypothetical protein FDZ84_31510 [Saccharopolyspora sp. ASAGF58]|nr:hypothetical protein FDZ84_31510 [Saccharopolyspora sp. ASAGF58]
MGTVVREFQASDGLETTGVVDPALMPSSRATCAIGLGRGVSEQDRASPVAQFVEPAGALVEFCPAQVEFGLPGQGSDAFG